MTVVGGDTSESALTGGMPPTAAYGYIALYLYDSMLPQWLKSLTPMRSTISGIALNPETKWIIAHSAVANPNFMLILDPDGNLKGAYTYVNSSFYQMMWRNLLLGYDPTT
jgi:hypothetical protein